jgi:hypothetical protein
MLQRQPTLAEYTQAMTELAAANAERDKAVKERVDADEEERDFILKFLQDMGEALGKARLVRLHPTRAGVEIRSLYSSPADALAAASRIRDLVALIALGENREALAAFEALEAAIEAAGLRA